MNRAAISPALPAPVDDWRHGGFGLYVHWPFCAAKCPYCDFNSHVRSAVDSSRWTRALVAEIERGSAEVAGRTVSSIFFGGGTPSLMPPETVAAVVDAIRRGWEVRDDAEVTLEANPTSVEAGRFRGYRDAGVNRLSMGIQALNDADLRALGRRHTVAEALRAFDVARAIFPRVSFDLIYARQGQTIAAWQTELRTALSLAVDHLSLYQLTIEPGTRFGELAARGKLRGLPTDALSADMYAATQEECGTAGLPAYEVSNHARPGAESQHNLVYWRYGDYLGVGPGAHSRLTCDTGRWAREAIRMPEAWLDAVESGPHGHLPSELVGPAEQASEMLMMGLRLMEGIDTARYAAMAGKPVDRTRILELEELNLIAMHGDRIMPTMEGRTVLNAVIRQLLV